MMGAGHGPSSFVFLDAWVLDLCSLTLTAHRRLLLSAVCCMPGPHVSRWSKMNGTDGVFVFCRSQDQMWAQAAELRRKYDDLVSFTINLTAEKVGERKMYHNETKNNKSCFFAVLVVVFFAALFVFVEKSSLWHVKPRGRGDRTFCIALCSCCFRNSFFNWRIFNLRRIVNIGGYLLCPWEGKQLCKWCTELCWG